MFELIQKASQKEDEKEAKKLAKRVKKKKIVDGSTRLIYA